ncbi:MAG: T9SS type A sorting domain-containing protein, partial [Ignavibacteriaceae bacterium]|nr:T9SS type A sorting domain-containing protein [Ignavibacteriaceae bacterium]
LHIRWDTATRRIAQTMVMTGRTDTIFAEVLNENNVKEYKLSQNYPNPFNPRTKIKYQIPELSFVTLKIYDVLGNKVATLFNEEKPAGSYEIEFNVANLTSGIYFYQLRTVNFIGTKKMILLK